MAILGRRKPGFSKVETVDPRTLSDVVVEEYGPGTTAEEAVVPAPVQEEEPLPANMAQALAQFVRNHSAAGMLVSLDQLTAEDPTIPSLFEQMQADPACGDIAVRKTAKDTYLYQEGSMSELYLMLNTLMLDGDDRNTIITMVRHNCKTFPTVTPYDYFTRTPFSMTMEHIEAVAQAILDSGEPADIAKTASPEGNPYLYSTDYFTPAYAKALAEFVEAND